MMDRQQPSGPLEVSSTAEKSIVRVSDKFWHPPTLTDSHNIVDLKDMSTTPQKFLLPDNDVSLAGKTRRRRLTSLTDVQPQSSFEEEDLATPSHSLIEHQDQVDRGYHTDPCIVTIRKTDEHARPRVFVVEEPVESSETIEESYEEQTLEQMLRKGTVLEHSEGVESALSFYDNAVKQELFKDVLNIAYLEYRMGTLLWKCGAYEQSLMALKRSLQAYENEGGMCIRTIAEIYFATGRTLKSLSKRTRARKYFMKALRTLEFDQFVDNNVNPEDQELYAKVLTQVASLLVTNGSYEMASSVLNEAITLQRQILGPEHTDIAGTLLVYGALNEALHQYEHAAKSYLEALEIFRNGSSTTIFSSVDISVTLSNVGWLFYLTRDYSSALHSYEEALELAIPILGVSHRNVSSLRVQIGMVYAQRGHLKKALKTYRQALEGQRAVLGDDHEDVALTLTLVGSVYKEMGRYAKAAEFTGHALTRRQEVLGSNSVVVGTTFVQLGQVYIDMGEPALASHCFSSALAIYHKNGMPVSDSRVGEAREFLAQII